MFLSLLFVCGTTGAASASAQVADSSVLKTAIDARQLITRGRLKVIETRFGRTGLPDQRVQNHFFNGDRYRIETVRYPDRDYAPLLRDGPWRIIVWDGINHLSQKVDRVNGWSVRNEFFAAGDPEIIARHRHPLTLGYPRGPGVGMEVGAMLRFARVADVHRDGDSVTVRGQRRETDGLADVSITFDKGKGWLPTAYEVERVQQGRRFVDRGFAVPARFGQTWFPAFFRHEQWSDEELDWAIQYEVVEASFDEEIPAELFDWRTFRLLPGANLISRIPGVPHKEWNSEKLEAVSIPGTGPAIARNISPPSPRAWRAPWLLSAVALIALTGFLTCAYCYRGR